MKVDLEFYPMDVLPRFEGDYCHDVLLINSCDGYHHYYANFSPIDNSFIGFSDWMQTKEENINNYKAWALLPCSTHISNKLFEDCKNN